MKSLLKDRKCANFKPFWFVYVFGGKEQGKRRQGNDSFVQKPSFESPHFLVHPHFFNEDTINISQNSLL